MVFSSLSFLFVFIPLTALFYFAFPSRRVKNAVLLISSLIFYSWGEPKLVLLMMLTAAVAYAGGILMERFKFQGKTELRNICYVTTVILITLNLVIFKYAGFFAENANALFGLSLTVPVIELPIGISFYTFQILSYVIDLKRGNVKLQKSYPRLLLYVCFFPQLIAGPIVRYSTVEEEIGSRKENPDEAAAGIRRFITGLAKKVILANGAAMTAEMIYAGDPEAYGRLMYWVAAVAYSLQLYYDFSGYSDMAIGLGQLFGFHFLENFDHPYMSRSVTEFWRRWHISLSSWFRDYVYIPMGGNRVSRPRWVFNIMTVWALTGFWHGASWNFVLWGLYYGVLLIIEKLFTGKLMQRLPAVLSWAVTAFIVVIGWTIFDLTDPAQLAVALKTMFTGAGFDYMRILAANTGIIEAMLRLVPCLLLIFPVGRLFKGLENSKAGTVLLDLWSFALLALCCVFLVSSTYNPFIYFRF